ncbi:MAG: transporter [Planctomycetaceae bacterium]|nr:transporter [Planctomycetaceae bacterium]
MEVTTKSRPKLAGTVILLGIASLLNDISSEMIAAVLPVFLLTLPGGTPLFLGLLEGAADSVASLLKLFSGPWSDRLSKRSGLIVVGYGLALITRPWIGLATAAWHVLVIRIADRIGKGIRTAPRDALIADVTAPDQRGRAFGFHRAMDHIGAVVGPLISAGFLWMLPGQYRLLFLLSIIPGICVILSLWFGLKEPAQHASADKPAFTLSLKPFDNNFRLFLVSLLLFTLGNSSDLFLLAHAQRLGMPIALLPILWSVFHVAKSLGNFLLGPLVDRIGPRPMILTGWTVYGIIYLLFGLSTAAWQMWILFLCYALFYAMTEPAEKTLVAALVPPDRKGLAFGWFNFALGIATFPASVLFGWLYEAASPFTAFATGATLALLAAILLLYVNPRPTPPPPTTAAN